MRDATRCCRRCRRCRRSSLAASPRAHGATAADSQSTFVAPSTRHTPRSAPVVSSAKSSGSFPESLIVNSTPGCRALIAAAEFSTSSGAAPRRRTVDDVARRGAHRVRRRCSCRTATAAAPRRSGRRRRPRRREHRRRRMARRATRAIRFSLMTQLSAPVQRAAPGVRSVRRPVPPARRAIDRRRSPPSSASITTAVDSHNAEALALLERIVNINSGTMNFAGVRQVADVLRPQFDALGFTTRWVDGAPFHRAGHLDRRASPARGQRYCSSATSIRCSSRAVRSSGSSG